VGRRNKIAAEEIVYWAPAASTEQESFSSVPKKEEEKEQAIYYRPPQTPQEAIEMGLVANKAVKPRSFIPHWERLGLAHKPKYWHCWWGCEGVQSVLDKDSKPTHDYYCPYWELLLLFPEWEEDFELTLYDRPPMPEGGPPYIEEQFNERKQQYLDAISRRNEEKESNPYNISSEQQQLQFRGTRIRQKRSDKDSGKLLAADGIRTTPFSKEYHESGTADNDNGWSFSEPTNKQKRTRKSNKRT